MKNRTYYGMFENWPDIASRFGGQCPARPPKYVFASYDLDGYEGAALVTTSQDGTSFDVVEASHCSCFGLEDMWEPTTHTRREIEKMLTAGSGWFHHYRDEIPRWLERCK